jgi:exodeoxyribonuclease-3
LVICGDYNICHEAIDIHDPIEMQKVSGFLPEERAWLDGFMKSGFVDSFRHFNKEPHNYSGGVIEPMQEPIIKVGESIIVWLANL